MKFKVGDKVKITKAMYEQDKEYEGKVVTIEYVDPYDSDRYMVKENYRPWKGCELELVEESEEIILKGVKKNNFIYEIELPKENSYPSCYITNDKVFICFIKKEILDDIEKEYLRNVIKPFRDKVKYIKKNNGKFGEYITICVIGELVNFPYFKKGKMYKNMITDKKYTLKELGL